MKSMDDKSIAINIEKHIVIQCYISLYLYSYYIYMTHISWYFMIVLSNPFNTIFFGNSPTWSNLPRASLRTCGRFQLCTSCRTTTSGSSGCSQIKRRLTSKTYEKWWKLVTFYSFSALCHVVPWKEMQVYKLSVAQDLTKTANALRVACAEASSMSTTWLT